MDNKKSNNLQPNETSIDSPSVRHLKKPLTGTTSLPMNMSSNSTPNTPNNLRKQINSSQVLNVFNLGTDSIPPSPTPSMKINRQVFNVREFNENYIPNETQKTAKEKLSKFKPDMSKKAWGGRLKRFLPITVWLPQYSVRKCLIADIIVGITIASFQVPQSMGYSLIAGVNPVYGLYSAFFPHLSYTVFGTSHHSSVGPVAIVAGLMTGNTVVEVCEELSIKVTRDQLNTTGVIDGYEDITKIDIAVMMSIIIGIYILVFGIFRLGFICNYLSDELVSGFMTASSIHVFTTQIRYLTGLTLENRSGVFAVPKVYIEFVEKINDVNLTAIVIAIIAMTVLLVFKLIIEKLITRMGLKLPLPIHLFVIIGGCIVSYLMDLNSKYQIDIVGEIPNEFQSPTLPKLKLFKYMWARCIPVAVVSYMLCLSVGRMYGAKHNYKVDPNQEMIALGITNIWSSFFSCLPSSASIPRSSVQEGGGGKTQIVSLVNCVCILIVILVLSSLLYDLPKSVLASCVSVALVSIFSKFQEFWNYWKISKLDGAIWMITFLGVVVLNIDYGIYIGFGCSLLLLIYKSQRPKTYSLGSVDDSDIYVPLSKFRRAKELQKVKIYQFCGPLNFANCEYFKKELQIRSGVDVSAIKEEMSSMTPHMSCFSFREPKSVKITDICLKNRQNLPKYIIIDCSMLSYIDTTGVTTLKKLVQSHADIDITVQLSGCPVHIETMLKNDGFFKEVSPESVYKSTHDAVIYIRDVDPSAGTPVNKFELNISKTKISRILSNISLDSNNSFDNYVTKDLKTPDSPRSILKNSPLNSPNLNRDKSERSVTFSYS